MTKVFMRRMFHSEVDEFYNGTVINDWAQVFENIILDEEDVYIDDKSHHAECWGSCYDESDLKDIIERRKKNESNKKVGI